MATVADIIRANHREIVRLWTVQAAKRAAARGLSQPEFANGISEFLSALAEAGEELGQFSGRRRELVDVHFASRLRQGFQLAEIVHEFALMGQIIASFWLGRPRQQQPDAGDVERLYSELQMTSAHLTEMFSRHMLEDEQADKQFRRRIQAIARESLHEDRPPLSDRLRDLLEVVMEAMGAQSAALLLYDPRTEHLQTAASVGVGGEELGEYGATLNQSSEPTSILDAATTELDVSPSLRRSGVHALLGVQLPARYTLAGALYIGLSTSRGFDAREIRRIELLGEQLSLHLDNARLVSDLVKHAEALRAERDLRERFVSVLAHDLRGPLSAAKSAAQVLLRSPQRRRELAMRIDRNIDRTDRMVQDLLDANRIRAGERLPLHIDECDLAAIAREVVGELIAVHGERFVLEADDEVVGFWSAEQLTRALWNLATNGVKYGAPDRPVTLTVAPTESGARASVHNHGSVISPDDQKKLFQPFSRTRSAQAGERRGWGLGLTLVQGCADAHGGWVTVDSDPERGTTFSLELPLDSRPYRLSPEPASPKTSQAAKPSFS